MQTCSIREEYCGGESRLGEWLGLAQKVYLLKEGCIVWSGTTHAAIDNPDAFLQASLALPAWIALTEKLRECEK